MSANLPEDARYLITASCIACGTCIKECPENCIKSGHVYEIDQSRCIKCGSCYDCCPTHAVMDLED
ncbi:MAG: 4Fe-4S binding protein [Eubacterium sp.]|nr:4Fe-4S binding protein [Eubacterium sp.]